MKKAFIGVFASILFLAFDMEATAVQVIDQTAWVDREAQEEPAVQVIVGGKGC